MTSAPNSSGSVHPSPKSEAVAADTQKRREADQRRRDADYARLVRQNRDLGARNQKLVELLKASRDKLQTLYGELEELSTPPSTYGTYLGTNEPGYSAEIFTGNRQMRVMVSPSVDQSDLEPGMRVRLAEGNIIVDTAGYTTSGELATVVERIGADRALIVSVTGDKSVVTLAGPIRGQAEAGDTLLVNLKVGYAFEVVPVTEMNRLNLQEIPDVTYDDIGGLDAQIEAIKDAVELPFLHPELYKAYDLRPPKGVLLYGPPGCGKTLIAKAVANSLASRIGGQESSYFLSIKGPELLNKFVGETERQIRVVFEQARDVAEAGRPVIIFFDEMESIFRTRGSGVSSDMETTVVPQLLAELDGVESLSNVIIIGATNREELIDPAILRPGRLDVKIRIDRPDRAGAVDIFSRYITDELPLAEPAEALIDYAVDLMFSQTPYVELTFDNGDSHILYYEDFISGAQIANVVDRAKKQAIKEHLASPESTGITRQILAESIAQEQHESEDLPNTQSPDEWTRIAAKRTKGLKNHIVVKATPL